MSLGSRYEDPQPGRLTVTRRAAARVSPGCPVLTGLIFVSCSIWSSDKNNTEWGSTSQRRDSPFLPTCSGRRHPRARVGDGAGASVPRSLAVQGGLGAGSPGGWDECDMLSSHADRGGGRGVERRRVPGWWPPRHRPLPYACRSVGTPGSFRAGYGLPHCNWSAGLVLLTPAASLTSENAGVTIKSHSRNRANIGRASSS